MSEAARLFRRLLIFIASLSALLVFMLGIFLEISVFAQTENMAEFKKNETGLYRDIFDQNVYYEGTNYLHLERLYRGLFRKKPRASDVNRFDEVPDSSFYTNRHSRTRLSAEELQRGYHETDAPDLSGDLTILGGRFEGLHPYFLVKDTRGDEYFLKFDPTDAIELVTSAEVITSRFYHALGYNVSQYSIVTFDPKKLIPAEGTTIYDDTGFKKKLTREKLDEYLFYIPVDSEGKLRASAQKILSGQNKGNFSFHGRRREDSQDPFLHKTLREIRALRVFASWLNHYDVREGNTQDLVIQENGKEILKHYLVDFNTALGANPEGAKPPMYTHEHLFDYGEILKAFFTLGLREKPWQKRWSDSEEKVKGSAAVGYFDNRYFDPGKFKTQLPHFAFKDLTRADAFWAAKILTAFSDEDIHAIVKAGELTNGEDADVIAKTLIERRDMIVRYWFDKSSPLDDFSLEGNTLHFKDLAVEKSFYPATGNVYRIEVIAKNGKHAKKIASLESQTQSADLQNWLSQNEETDLLIRAVRPSAKPSPYVLVELDSKGVAGILHED